MRSVSDWGPPLTREVLDTLQCQNPNCQHTDHSIMPFPKCHRHAGLAALYEDGVLTLMCAKCERIVVCIAVAALPRQFAATETGRPS